MLEFFHQKALFLLSFNQENVFEVLLILMAIIWTSGALFRRFKLPLMLGELLAGILIGPAVLGLMEQTETIQILAELGVFFMLLHAGLESNPVEMLKASRLSILITVVSLLFSFISGYLLGLALGFFFQTALFLGMLFSFSSIAILHNTLKSLKLKQFKISTVLSASMLLNDLMAFVIFSVVMAVLDQGSLTYQAVFLIILKVLIFMGASLFLGHKILPKFFKVFNTSGMKGFTFTLVVALFFGLIAEKIGLNVILGAYLAGVFIRQNVGDLNLYNKIEDRIFALSYSFLGPIFFASIGLYISFDILTGSQVLIFLSIFLTAILSKFLSSCSVVCLSRQFSLRESLGIGIGMVAKGEMILILAKVGREKIIDFGNGIFAPVLNESLFSAIVLMMFFAALISALGLKYIAGYKGNKLKI